MLVETSHPLGCTLKKWAALSGVDSALVVSLSGSLEKIGLQELPTDWVKLDVKPTELLHNRTLLTNASRQHALAILQLGEQYLETLEALLNAAANSEIYNLALIIIAGQDEITRQKIESAAFNLGYRKHPAYYVLLDYEGLQNESELLFIPLEKIPYIAHDKYPQQSLRNERDLHMDMLREPGERSDAHIIRYQLAVDLIRPGDRVLDAACGLGYGSHVMASLTRCAYVLGVDGSEYAVDYARMNFSKHESRVEFRKGYLPDDLAELADELFDVIISFETLEHIENPVGLLAEFSRLLRPGGRIIASVPNDWSDESGEDPNPHHLHVYTLDKLRQQFSTFFARKTLHQQIASGCKTRASGNKWTPLPRLLREVPVDTDLPPDSEWWIMAGNKPDHSKETNLAAPWYSAIKLPWSDLDSQDSISKGVILAVNCTPEATDPRVLEFWGILAQQLAQKNYSFMLLSTTPVSNQDIQVIDLPFLLPDFSQRYQILPSDREKISEREIMDVVSWYGCDYQTARKSLRLAHDFFSDLLDTLRPAAILGWQSGNPVTDVLRAESRAARVPFWSGERGWVRNTLMFDLCENNFLGEANTSLALNRLRDRYHPSSETLESLKARTIHAAELGRYASAERLSRHAWRVQNGIPEDAKVFAFFNHGEPSLNSIGRATTRELHGISNNILQQRLDEVTDALLARGYWLLVQEHPFNRSAGRALKVRNDPHVLSVNENATTLLHAADHYLFTLSTLQFDAAFLDKSFGLLSRSALYRAGTPPFIDDFETVNTFLDAVLDEDSWPGHLDRLQRDTAFLYENMLLDIEPDAINESAALLKDHLTQFVRPLNSGVFERIERFLQKWAGA